LKRILIAANTRSARGKGASILQEAERNLAQRGAQCDVLVSQGHGHFFEALPARLREPWDAVVALGGDGTLFQVLNCCLKQEGFNTPLGLIPAGTGNSFSKEFRHQPAQPAWQRLLEGQAVPVDVLRCRLRQAEAWHGNEYFFINVMGLGFVSEVNINSQRFKRLGAVSYVLGLLVTLKNFKAARLHLTLDDQTLERTAMFAVICNSRYTGGNMWVAPGAEIDDGVMEVVVLNELSRAGLLRAFPSVYTGRHVDHPKVEIFRCRRLRIECDTPQLLNPDGEILGATPAEIEVLPRRVRFIL
jgi:YegS/Rv2252/BmrU family lipid kinase